MKNAHWDALQAPQVITCPHGSSGCAIRGTDYSASAVASSQAPSLSHTASPPCAEAPHGPQSRSREAVLCQGCRLGPHGSCRYCACPSGCPRTPIQDRCNAEIVHQAGHQSDEGYRSLPRSLSSPNRQPALGIPRGLQTFQYHHHPSG